MAANSSASAHHSSAYKRHSGSFLKGGNNPPLLPTYVTFSFSLFRCCFSSYIADCRFFQVDRIYSSLFHVAIPLRSIE